MRMFFETVQFKREILHLQSLKKYESLYSFVNISSQLALKMIKDKAEDVLNRMNG